MIKFKAWRKKSDREKALLPTLMLVTSSKTDPLYPDVMGFMVCLGWWDFAVGVLFAKMRPK